MNYLLDTHVLIWYLKGNELLPKKAREEISNAENEVYYSILSIFEIELKRTTRPDSAFVDIETILKLCEESGFIQLPLKVAHVMELKNLKRLEYAPPHKDPFDKLLLCQAISEEFQFMTHDKLIAGYETPNLYKV